jgi:hypothetical protein
VTAKVALAGAANTASHTISDVATLAAGAASWSSVPEVPLYVARSTKARLSWSAAGEKASVMMPLLGAAADFHRLVPSASLL